MSKLHKALHQRLHEDDEGEEEEGGGRGGGGSDSDLDFAFGEFISSSSPLMPPYSVKSPSTPSPPSLHHLFGGGIGTPSSMLHLLLSPPLFFFSFSINSLWLVMHACMQLPMWSSGRGRMWQWAHWLVWYQHGWCSIYGPTLSSLFSPTSCSFSFPFSSSGLRQHNFSTGPLIPPHVTPTVS